jgi:inorganic pyrophosphatase
MVPGKANKVSIGNAYGYEHAKVVLAAAMADYDEDYGDVLAE